MNQIRKTKNLTSKPTQSNAGVFAWLLVVMWIVFCVGSAFLATRPVTFAAGGRDNYLNYTWVNDVAQKVYNLDFVKAQQQTDKVWSMYFSGGVLYITDSVNVANPELWNPILWNTNTLSASWNILWWKNVSLSSKNVSVLWWEWVTVSSGNDNSSVWWWKVLKLFTREWNVPSVLIGWGENEIWANHDGNVIVGWEKNTLSGGVVEGMILWWKDNTVSSSTGVVVAWSNVKVENLENVFVFSDGDWNFVPTASGAFYLNVREWVGVNMDSKWEWISSKGSVGLWDVNINTLSCDSDNLGLQWVWDGCLVWCTQESINAWSKWSLLNKSESCKTKCDTNDKCRYEPDLPDVVPYSWKCVSLEGGQWFSSDGKKIIEWNKTRAVLCESRDPYATWGSTYETLVIDVDDTCPALNNNSNQCIYKCSEWYHLKPVTIGGKTVKKCMQDCKVPWSTDMKEHDDTITAYQSSSVTCTSTCKSEIRKCNDGVWGGSYTNADCTLYNKTCSDSYYPLSNCSGEWVVGCSSCDEYNASGKFQCNYARTKYRVTSCDSRYDVKSDGTGCTPKSCRTEPIDGYTVEAGPHGTVRTPSKVVGDKQYSKTFKCEFGEWKEWTESEVDICVEPTSSCGDWWISGSKSWDIGSTSYTWTCKKSGESDVTCNGSCSNGAVWNGTRCESADLCRSTHYNCNLSTSSEGKIISGGWTWKCTNDAWSESCHECENGYTWNSTTKKCEINCGAKRCGGEFPDNATKNDGNRDGKYTPSRNASTNTCEPASLDWHYSTSSEACAFKCNTNYTWDGDSCELDWQTGSCWWTVPSNATKKSGHDRFVQTWNWSAWTPSTKSWAYNADECGFLCDTGYTRTGSICKENTATLTYNANWCGTAPNAVTMKYSTETKAASMISVTSWKSFTKWCTQSNGRGTCYNVGDVVNAKNVTPEDIILYAQCSDTNYCPTTTPTSPICNPSTVLAQNKTWALWMKDFTYTCNGQSCSGKCSSNQVWNWLACEDLNDECIDGEEWKTCRQSNLKASSENGSGYYWTCENGLGEKSCTTCKPWFTLHNGSCAKLPSCPLWYYKTQAECESAAWNTNRNPNSPISQSACFSDGDGDCPWHSGIIQPPQEDPACPYGYTYQSSDKKCHISKTVCVWLVSVSDNYIPFGYGQIRDRFSQGTHYFIVRYSPCNNEWPSWSVFVPNITSEFDLCKNYFVKTPAFIEENKSCYEILPEIITEDTTPLNPQCEWWIFDQYSEDGWYNGCTLRVSDRNNLIYEYDCGNKNIVDPC